MKKLSLLLLLLFFTALLCCGPASAQITTAATNPLPAKQLMVVITDNWDTLQGKLYCYQKQEGKWVLQFSNMVVIGSKGLGVGDGLFKLQLANAPVKKEGDEKSPAGIFTIGTAFGYADAKNATWIKNRYVKASDTIICVDDMHSAYYNTLVQRDTAKSPYNSHEEMHLKKAYYKWGLFINHNSGNVVPGDGSCIFMHIWGNSTEGTDGCTAMAEPNLLRILHWINAEDHPLLVQLTRTDYLRLRKQLGLPALM